MVREIGLAVPCKNMKMGCRERAPAKEDPDDDSIVFLDSIEEHEKDCNHRPLVFTGEMKPFVEYLNMLKEWPSVF